MEKNPSTPHVEHIPQHVPLEMKGRPKRTRLECMYQGQLEQEKTVSIECGSILDF